MNKTKIEWVRNQDDSQGFTSNPVRGECPVGCPYCYVKSFRARYNWHKDIRFYPSELEAIRKRKKPAGIFVGSTIELFHDKTIQYIPEIMDTIRACPQHRFYMLTKQPQNLIKFSPFPDNCWVGVTATNYDSFIEACGILGSLRHKYGTMTYISIEPLLSWDSSPGFTLSWLLHGEIPWVIIGSQTKPCRPPAISDVEEIVRACDKAGIQVFLKNNLEPMCFSLTKSQLDEYSFWETSYTDDEFIVGVDLRQELPK